MNSIRALLDELARQQIRLHVDGDRLHVSAPPGVLTPALQQQLRERKLEILQFLRQMGDRGVEPPIAPALRGANIPLSFAQQRLWFIDQLQPASSAYVNVAGYRLEGALNLSALRRSLDEIVRRHESLRTNFVVADGQPWQAIHPTAEFPFHVHECSHLPVAEWDAEIERHFLAERGRPFDLARDVMRRGLLLRFGERQHVLFIASHHIASDAWSNGVFWRELTALYTAFSHGQPASLPELPVQYADYAIWQRQSLSGQRLARQLDYWRGQLTRLEPLNLPTDHPRPADYSYRGRRFHFTLSPHLTAGLHTLAQAEGATLYMTLLAAFFTLLYRHTGQTRIAVGSPILHRSHVELENVIGFFANTLVMAGDLSGNPTFRDLLRRVRRVALDAYEHQDLPFEKLVEELQPERSLNRNPLFQVLFQLLSGVEGGLTLPGVKAERLSMASASTRFDLELHLHLVGETLFGSLVYATDLFEPVTAEALVGRFQTLLERIVGNPDQTIDALPILHPDERRRLLVEWNDTPAVLLYNCCVHRLFEEQTARNPEAVAARFGEQSITYGELNRRANQLAHHLQSLGVGPDVAVGLFAQRSIETLVGLLAILKAGGAYTPLDPNHPVQRLATILHNTRLSVLLVQAGLEPGGFGQNIQVVHVDADGRPYAMHPESAPESAVTPDHLAYVIHTSGSTGQPKGVAMSHRALANLLAWHQSHPELHKPERALQFAPLHFDVSFQEMFAAWCSGGTLILVDEETRRDPHLLWSLIRCAEIERMYLPMTALQQMAEAMTPTVAAACRLRTVITAGEQLRITASLRRMMTLLPECKLYNHYGPTESHVATEYVLPPQPQSWPELPAIGRPISHVRIFILDAGGRLLPIGAIGELYIAGVGLARGYLHRPSLTAERFLPDPHTPGERLYRTGDLARWRWDGLLEFVGRADDQVKLRGYRVEPGEVEAALTLHPQVSACAVVVQQNAANEAQLVAYFTPLRLPAPTAGDLRDFLRASLPDYMIPAVFVQLETLPLTSSGKIHRRALPAAQMDAGRAVDAVNRPSTATEEKLAVIWADILGLSQVGVHESFFDLGGHSLLAVRLFARMEDEFGVRLPLALLFRHQTIARLAPHLAQPAVPRHEWRTLVAIQPGGARPPFFCVHGFGGGVVGYAALARLLGPEQPFYGLQAAGLDGDEAPDLNVEAMAARYVAAMRSVQPQGPYRIGGYCFGGVVAFEMARQLDAQGEQVALLAIMEGHAPGTRRRRASRLDAQRLLTIWRNLPYWWEDYWRLGAREINLRAQRNVRRWRWLLTHGAGAARPVDVRDVLPGDAAFVPDHQRRLMEIHLAAMRAYRPQPFGGAATLFAARGRTITNALTGSLDPQRGWGALALGGVTVRVVAGGHRNIHLPPNVASLAVALAESLM